MKCKITSYNAIKGNHFVLSSSLHNDTIDVANQNLVPLHKLMSHNLSRSDLGKEVGSKNYVTGSDFHFIKTKALQADSFIPTFDTESTESITPQSFIDYKLKEGDVLLSKDSNIGEIVILDKDYPNYMPSGALYKLPLNRYYKHYALAFIKHSYFREQLDRLVPKGATLRHAGTRFLDCFIPFPEKREMETINHITYITKTIINIEIEIRNRHKIISDLIETEIVDNQNQSRKYQFFYPSYRDLVNGKRIDTGIYSTEFRKIEFLLRNYKHGSFYIDTHRMRSGNTPRIREISNYEQSDLRWITPSNCSDWGYIDRNESIQFQGNNNLNNDAVLLINRTSRGGKGEYVGIGTFYDYGLYGKGHHNQGIYRISGYDKKLLIFITCFMNTALMRRYCSFLCVGSKMKEIKANQFLSIPIPIFEPDKLNIIYNLFYTDNFNRSIDSLLNMNLKKVGLLHLNIAKETLNKHLSSLLDNIINNHCIVK